MYRSNVGLFPNFRHYRSKKPKATINRSVSGADITSAYSLSILLFSKSGVEAFPVASDFNTDLTSSSSMTILSKV